MIKGTEMFVKALKMEGVDTVFAYPGGQVIDLFDALYDVKDINIVLPRHEQALVHEADGYARATGKVGVCLVTSGPGATNLVTGIATANYDSVPLVCFTGQVPTSLIGNDAFQEVDIVGITRSITKYSVTVRRREDLARVIKNAFYIAKTGKPGVVLVDIPKDVQIALGDDDYSFKVDIRGYKPNESVHIGQIKKAIHLLKDAKKPVILAGGGVNVSNARNEMLEFARMVDTPVITTIMGKGCIPTNDPLYIGNIGLHGMYAANKAIMECDLLFSIGTRFNDRITGKISEFAKNAKIVHIDIDAASISRNIVVDIPIVADAKMALERLLEACDKLNHADWVKEIQEIKNQYPISMKQSGLTPEFIFKNINELFKNKIVVADVGQNQLWATQFTDLENDSKLLSSGGLGTMGYGLPGAIGAKIGDPNKDVIMISGDGGFQMNIQELATASQEELDLILCVFNNTYLGNVRQWQEMFFDKRYSQTCLKARKSCKRDCKNCPNPEYIPNFVKIAEGYGLKGIRVTKKEEVMDALMMAKKMGGTVLIEFMISPFMNVMPMVKMGHALDEMILEE